MKRSEGLEHNSGVRIGLMKTVKSRPPIVYYHMHVCDTIPIGGLGKARLVDADIMDNRPDTPFCQSPNPPIS